MATFEDIFKTSDLSEDKKKSKNLFGRLLVKLRKENRIKLYSLLGGAVDTDLCDGVLKVTLGDKASFDMSNNQNDLNILNASIQELDDNISSIKLEFDNKKVFDLYQFEQYLKDEFGKILVIK